MNKAEQSIWNDGLGRYVAAPDTVTSGDSKTSFARKVLRNPARAPTQRLALEPRIVFDGALAAEGLSAVGREVLLTALAPVERAALAESNPIAQEAALPQAVAKESAYPDPIATPERLPTELANPATAAPMATEIVFISANVGDLQTFLADRPGTEVVVLDANRDGMAQMAAALAGRTGISAIHILSHGQAGQVFLGSTTLSTSSIMGEHADALASIKASLTQDADILIYGCDAGADTTGQNFINALADATGADVAASTDKTGAAERGGDWVLEAQTGRIETAVVLELRGQAEYQGLLAAFSINAATAPVLTVGAHVGGPLNGNTATYANVGTVGGLSVNLIATITSSTVGDIVNFSASAGSPACR